MRKYGEWPSTQDLTGGLCEKMDPDLWTKDHHPTNEPHTICGHAVAVHLCQRHCPIRQQCLERAQQQPAIWAGMVMGGVLWTAEGKPAVSSPEPGPAPWWCPTCQPVVSA